MSEKSAVFWAIGQELAVAEGPAAGREVAREDPDFGDEWL